MNQPYITFIAPVHNETEYNRALLDSLMAQTDPNWKLIVFHNGPSEEMRNWTEGYNDSRIVYEESAQDTGMWGTINRQTAITYMVDTPYVINTSIQDYYLPNAVAELNKIITTQQPDLITWQAMNHLFRYGVLTGEIAYGHIDWGQWVVKTEHIRKVGIIKGNEFSSDWYTLQAIIATGCIKQYNKVDKILTIHH